MSLILACDLGLNGKTLSPNFFRCFVFHFRQIMQAKMEVFVNQPWRQMRTSLILMFGKTKALFGKDGIRQKNAFLQTLFVVYKQKRNQRTKLGAMFFYEVEGHMQKFIWTSKKIWPRRSLGSVMQAPPQLTDLFNK